MKDYTIYVTREILDLALSKGYKLIPALFDFPYQIEIKGIQYRMPTAEQICGWLREEHYIRISIDDKLNGDYEYYGYAHLRSKPEYGVNNWGNNYNEVMIDIINKALNLI